MYKTATEHQITFSDFNQSCGMQLDTGNEWIRLADALPWDTLENLYAALFTGSNGHVAAPFRLVLGSLIIQQRLSLTDRGLVKEISENPYLQYFIGFTEFRADAPFHHTALVKFRKRISAGLLVECNNAVIETLSALEDRKKEQEPKKRGRKKADEKPDENGNLGSVTLDATCAPVYIRFPQDYSLLNEARVKLEGMIDWYYKTYGFETKPRTYRRVARQEYLKLAKTKKPSEKLIRATVRKMLSYVRRDLGYIEGYMSQGYAPDRKMVDTYLTITELYEQQQYMWDNKTHKVEHRIVSISQPWIRPIKRGKAKAPVEFGPKFEISLDERGYARMEQASFDSFNESERLQKALESYYTRTGHWPKRVLVDQIYRTRLNREFCKKHGIRMSGPKLGRPPKDEAKSAKDRKIEHTDNIDRIGVERFFSLGKRCNGMGLITTKLSETQMVSLALSLLVTNLFRHAGAVYFFVIYFDATLKVRTDQFAFFDEDETDRLYQAESVGRESDAAVC